MIQVLRNMFTKNATVASRVTESHVSNCLKPNGFSVCGPFEEALNKLRREQASVLLPLGIERPSLTQRKQLQEVARVVCEVQQCGSDAMLRLPVLSAPGCLSPERSGPLQGFLQWQHIMQTANDRDFNLMGAPQTVARQFSNTCLRGEPYFVVNLLDIVAQMKRWNEELPFVRPYFAAKCNFDATILRLLHALDCGFDCASPAEFEGLFDLGILDASSGPQSDQCVATNTVFSNPCKSPAALRIARQMGVKFFSLDSVFEVSKLKHEVPDACALVRLKVDDSNSSIRLSSKFGADLKETLEILHECNRVGLRTVGVSFHVGSGSKDPSQFDRALAVCRQVFDALKADAILSASPFLSRFDVLDLGGGFPGDEALDDATTFESNAQAIRQSLARHFPASLFGSLQRRKLSAERSSATGLTVIAEPGRYFVEKSHTLVCEVIAKKKEGNSKPVFKYYLNDGLYTSFFALIFDEPMPHFFAVRNGIERVEGDEFETVLFGQTCDGVDIIAADGCHLFLPQLQVSDKILVPAFGAYTVALSTQFNGFPPPKCFYVA